MNHPRPVSEDLREAAIAAHLFTDPVPEGDPRYCLKCKRERANCLHGKDAYIGELIELIRWLSHALESVVEDCDHSVGICWCEEKRLIDEAKEVLKEKAQHDLVLEKLSSIAAEIKRIIKTFNLRKSQ